MSIKPGPLGTNPLQRSPRTPGPLGLNDAADSLALAGLIGDTPGPLGINDHAAQLAFGGAPMTSEQQGASEPSAILSGISIDIAFKLNGSIKHKYVITDFKGWFQWEPPPGVSEVYFRTMDSQLKHAIVLLQNELPGTGMLKLWTPEEACDFSPIVSAASGCVSGLVVESVKLDPYARAFEFMQLPPDRIVFAPMQVDDAPLKMSDKFMKELNEAAKRRWDKANPPPKQLKLPNDGWK